MRRSRASAALALLLAVAALLVLTGTTPASPAVPVLAWCVSSRGLPDLCTPMEDEVVRVTHKRMLSLPVGQAVTVRRVQ